MTGGELRGDRAGQVTDFEIIGDDREVLRPAGAVLRGRVMLVALLAVLSLGGALVMTGAAGRWSAAAGVIAPSAVSLPQPLPQPHPAAVGALGGGSLNLTGLAIGAVCAPVTDGRRRLRVSFELINISDDDLTLMVVSPSLPLRGLTPIGAVEAGGTCDNPDRQAVGGLMEPGDRILVTMRFALPSRCPGPLPVAAMVRAQAFVGPASTVLPVLSDLGRVRFDACPLPNARYLGS